MGNTSRAVNLMRDLSPEQRGNLMKHVAEREAARLRWQQATFTAVVTFLSICAPLTAAAISLYKVRAVVTWLLKGSVVMAVVAVLAGLVVMQADLHTKSRFVDGMIETLRTGRRDTFTKYTRCESVCAPVMVGAFVASVLLLLAAVLCI